MKRYLLFALLLCSTARATAQETFRNAAAVLRRISTIDTLRFPEPPSPVWASPGTFWYRIPADSVAAVVYGARTIEPNEAWLRTPAFIVKRGMSEDSTFGSLRVTPGSYLGISIREGTVYLNVRRKPVF